MEFARRLPVSIIRLVVGGVRFIWITGAWRYHRSGADKSFAELPRIDLSHHVPRKGELY
jgi:hypothetical protein